MTSTYILFFSVGFNFNIAPQLWQLARTHPPCKFYQLLFPRKVYISFDRNLTREIAGDHFSLVRPGFSGRKARTFRFGLDMIAMVSLLCLKLGFSSGRCRYVGSGRVSVSLPAPPIWRRPVREVVCWSSELSRAAAGIRHCSKLTG